MRYVMARINAEHRDMIYRIYVTETLRAVVQNTSGEDKTVVMNQSYRQYINPKPVDNRSSAEVVDMIRKKLEE